MRPMQLTKRKPKQMRLGGYELNYFACAEVTIIKSVPLHLSQVCLPLWRSNDHCSFCRLLSSKEVDLTLL